VTFGIRPFKLGRSQRERFADALHKEQPRRLRPRVAGNSRGFDAVAIYDRGTRGLRDDRSPMPPTRRTGLRRFVFSIGETKPATASSSQAEPMASEGRRSSRQALSGQSWCTPAASCRNLEGRAAVHRNELARAIRAAPDSKESHRSTLVGGRRRVGSHLSRETRRTSLPSHSGCQNPSGEFGTTVLILQPRWSMSDGGTRTRSGRSR